MWSALGNDSPLRVLYSSNIASQSGFVKLVKISKKEENQ
jgi:hypothetical protein